MTPDESITRGNRAAHGIAGGDMKAVIQPLAWGLALAAMLALASGVALDMAVHDAASEPQLQLGPMEPR